MADQKTFVNQKLLQYKNWQWEQLIKNKNRFNVFKLREDYFLK